MIRIDKLLEYYLDYYKGFSDNIKGKYGSRSITLIGNTFWYDGLSVGNLIKPVPKFSYIKYVIKYPEYKEFFKELDLCLENPFEAYNNLTELKNKIYECV